MTQPICRQEPSGSEPLYDAMNIDSLWIGLMRANDECLKTIENGEAAEFIDLSGEKARDGIGPVLKKTVLHPSRMRYSDTLLITLSEPVKRGNLVSVSPEIA